MFKNKNFYKHFSKFDYFSTGELSSTNLEFISNYIVIIIFVNKKFIKTNLMVILRQPISIKDFYYSKKHIYV